MKYKANHENYIQDKIGKKKTALMHRWSVQEARNDLKHLSIAEVRNDVSLDGWVRAEENHNREIR